MRLRLLPTLALGFTLSLLGSPASNAAASLPVRVTVLRQTSASTSEPVFVGTGNLSMSSSTGATLTVPPGFYVATVAVEGTTAGQIGGAPEGQFYFGLGTSFVDRPGGAFQGGAVVGGYHNTHPFGGVSGFAAFCLGTQHTASVRVFSAPTYGVTGARDLRLQILDAQQNVIIAHPTSGGGSVPGQLTNGVPVNGSTNSSSPNADFDEYTVVIPAGASNLSIATSNANADLDLYVRFGQAPTLSSYDCRPFLTGGNETCTFASPSAGTYYVRVYGFATGTQNYTIRATWNP